MVHRDRRQKFHLEVLRNKDRLAFDVPVIQAPHEMGSGRLARRPREKISCVRLGIIGVEIDAQKSAQ